MEMSLKERCIDLLVENYQFQINEKNELEDYPMLPVRLFKEFILKSIPTKRIFKKWSRGSLQNKR